MSRGKNSDSGRPKARSVARYTIYNVTEPAELMDFLMRKMAIYGTEALRETAVIYSSCAALFINLKNSPTIRASKSPESRISMLWVAQEDRP